MATIRQKRFLRCLILALWPFRGVLTHGIISCAANGGNCHIITNGFLDLQVPKC